MIQVQDVTKAFAGKKLFESVSTTFPPGRRYGLTGPNGAGKSTFMKILAGELEPDTGVISRPKRFSVLKQDQYAFEDRKVLDVVLMGNAALWEAMQEKERLLAKPDLTDEDGARLGELEGVIAEEDGYSAEAQAATLLEGLGIYESDHPRLMKEMAGGNKARALLAQGLFARPAAGVRRALLCRHPRFPGAEPHQAAGEAVGDGSEEVEHRPPVHQVRAEAAEREADADHRGPDQGIRPGAVRGVLRARHQGREGGGGGPQRRGQDDAAADADRGAGARRRQDHLGPRGAGRVPAAGRGADHPHQHHLLRLPARHRSQRRERGDPRTARPHALPRRRRHEADQRAERRRGCAPAVLQADADEAERARAGRADQSSRPGKHLGARRRSGELSG